MGALRESDWRRGKLTRRIQSQPLRFVNAEGNWFLNFLFLVLVPLFALVPGFSDIDLFYFLISTF
jgi:hypothetical protein